MKSDLHRFLEKVDVDLGCLIWKGTTVKSKLRYGQFFDGKKTVMAHRWIYERWHGRKIANGMTIDHQCNNSLCVNPTHLKEMSLRENIMRSSKSACSVNAKKSSCPQGHPYDRERKNGYRFCSVCKKSEDKKYKINKKLKRMVANG